MLSGGLPKAGVARCSRKRRCQSSRYASSPLRSLPPPGLDAGGAGDCLHATAQLSRASMHQLLRMLPLGVRAQGLAAADGGMPSLVCGETGVLEVIYCRSVAAALKQRATAVTPRPGRLRTGWIR